jgi:hypothetical protein
MNDDPTFGKIDTDAETAYYESHEVTEWLAAAEERSEG